MLAASVGCVEVVDYLKEVTELNAKDYDGRNLAHLSMLHSNEATQQLMEFLKVLHSFGLLVDFYFLLETFFQYKQDENV